jgi:hypothetical protein
MSYDAPPPPPPPPGGGYGQQPPYGAAPVGTNKKALWSMILGILSIICCTIFTGIPAIILSRMAQKEIETTGGQGAGMAKAGLILGIISCAFAVLWLILVISGNGSFSFSTS